MEGEFGANCAHFTLRCARAPTISSSMRRGSLRAPLWRRWRGASERDSIRHPRVNPWRASAIGTVMQSCAMPMQLIDYAICSHKRLVTRNRPAPPTTVWCVHHDQSPRGALTSCYCTARRGGTSGGRLLSGASWYNRQWRRDLRCLCHALVRMSAATPRR